MTRKFVLLACASLALCGAALAQGKLIVGPKRGRPPKVRTALVKARAAKLRAAKKTVISVRGSNALSVRVLEDCMTVELLGVGIDVVSKPKAERAAFTLRQRASKELEAARATAKEKEAKDKKKPPPKGEEPEKTELKFRGLTDLAKEAGAEIVCDATLLQQVVARGPDAGDPEKAMKTCLSVVVVDAASEEILWAGSLYYDHLVSLPQVAKDTIEALDADRRKK